MKNQNTMTQEQLNNPRQFNSIIEEKTNFYSHTGDGGNLCYASNCDTIEKVWVECEYETMKDYTNENATSVKVSISGNIDMVALYNSELTTEERVDIITNTPMVYEKSCNTLEEIISALNEIEATLIK
jgi:hypothetical protein